MCIFAGDGAAIAATTSLTTRKGPAFVCRSDELGLLQSALPFASCVPLVCYAPTIIICATIFYTWGDGGIGSRSLDFFGCIKVSARGGSQISGCLWQKLTPWWRASTTSRAWAAVHAREWFASKNGVTRAMVEDPGYIQGMGRGPGHFGAVIDAL